MIISNYYLKLLLIDKFLRKCVKLANMNIKSSYMIKMIAFIKLLYNKKNHSINSYTRKLNIYFTKLFNKTEVVLINKKITPEVNVIKNYWLTSFVREKKNIDSIERYLDLSIAKERLK